MSKELFRVANGELQGAVVDLLGVCVQIDMRLARAPCVSEGDGERCEGYENGAHGIREWKGDEFSWNRTHVI